MKKDITRYFGICIFFILFSCGSYYYSEGYKFDISREELINRIKKFKETNPEYRLFTTNEEQELMEYPEILDTTDIFYSSYFYLKNKDLTLHCVINMSKEVKDTPAIIRFTGISHGVRFSSWKRVNSKDLTKEENKEIKRIFETEILDKLGTWERE
jgi:hypothetical protein